MKHHKDPPKLQRNASCRCGSGKKYKKCHLLLERKQQEDAERNWRENLEKRAFEAAATESQKLPRKMNYALLMAASAIALSGGHRRP